MCFITLKQIFKYIMLSWIIQITIISIIFIFLVHHLINFFKTTLTVPKIKDLVNSTNNEYKNIYEILKQKSQQTYNQNNNHDTNNSDYSLIDLLPQTQNNTSTDDSNMKNELKSFLKKQLNNDNTSNISISGLDSFSNFQTYSNFKT